MLCAFKLFYNYLLFTSLIIKTKTKKYLVITTSKLNNNIAFGLAIFWGQRADEMGSEGRGAEDKGRGSRNTNTPDFLCYCLDIKSIMLNVSNF